MNTQKKANMALLVTDEEELAAAMKAELDAMGFDAVIAIDAIHAKQIIDERPPAFVCTNLILPRGSGYDVCQLVRGSPTLAGVPLLVMDDRWLPEEVAFAEEEAKADAFLTKPFTMDEFRAFVWATLERRSQRAMEARAAEGGDDEEPICSADVISMHPINRPGAGAGGRRQ